MTTGARQPGSAERGGSGDHGSRLLWTAGVTVAIASAAAFALWVTNGAGILFDMMLALCL